MLYSPYKNQISNALYIKKSDYNLLQYNKQYSCKFLFIIII